jgi:hypothetical protein
VVEALKASAENMAAAARRLGLSERQMGLRKKIRSIFLCSARLNGEEEPENLPVSRKFCRTLTDPEINLNFRSYPDADQCFLSAA